MKYKNMKIEINDEQSLNDVVMELERLGYKKNCNLTSGINWIVCFEGGFYCQYGKMNAFNKVLTTITELKAMR